MVIPSLLVILVKLEVGHNYGACPPRLQIQIPLPAILGASPYGLYPALIGHPASGQWDWSPGLVSPLARIPSYQKNQTVLDSQETKIQFQFVHQQLNKNIKTN